MCKLSKEGSHEVKELKNKWESVFNQKIDLQSQNVGINW